MLPVRGGLLNTDWDTSVSGFRTNQQPIAEEEEYKEHGIEDLNRMLDDQPHGSVPFFSPELEKRPLQLVQR